MCWSEIVWTIVFAGDGLLVQFILFGWLFGCMFVVHWFALLYGRVIMGVVVIEAGLRAALASSFCLFFEGIILRRVPLFLVVASFWCIHHVYVVSWGGFPVPDRRWFLVVSGIVVHTIDIFGVEV